VVGATNDFGKRLVQLHDLAPNIRMLEEEPMQAI
jgi:hypothetical protein